MDSNQAVRKIHTDLRTQKKELQMSTKVSTKKVVSSRKENPDGEITAVFTNAKVTQPTAKRMRKWLRTHNLTVRDAVKKGSNWIFNHAAPDGVKTAAEKKAKAAPAVKAEVKPAKPVTKRTGKTITAAEHLAQTKKDDQPAAS
jgi:hypothetical protein